MPSMRRAAAGNFCTAAQQATLATEMLATLRGFDSRTGAATPQQVEIFLDEVTTGCGGGSAATTPTSSATSTQSPRQPWPHTSSGWTNCGPE